MVCVIRSRWLLLVPAVACVGCAKQINNPWTDSGAWANAMLTTASADEFRAQNANPPQATRVWPNRSMQPVSGSVTHWPIWWEDPFVDKGNDATDPNNRDRADQQFAQNGVDILAVPLSISRFGLNTVAWPVSAVVTPPGAVMVSDGRISKQALGYDHDAARSSPDAEPPHVVDQSSLMREQPSSN